MPPAVRMLARPGIVIFAVQSLLQGASLVVVFSAGAKSWFAKSGTPSP